jgi:hypothetical protein
MSKKKQQIKEATSYDLHSLLDYLLVTCAHDNKSVGKRIRVPYKNVFPTNVPPELANAELCVEIKVFWDAKLQEVEPASTAPIISNKKH